MTATGVEQFLRSSLPRLAGLGAVVRFDLGADGAWVVDARSGHPMIVAGDRAADCVILVGAVDLVKLLKGQLDPIAAYTLGQIKVSGSLNVAMRLAAMLG